MLFVAVTAAVNPDAVATVVAVTLVVATVGIDVFVRAAVETISVVSAVVITAAIVTAAVITDSDIPAAVVDWISLSVFIQNPQLVLLSITFLFLNFELSRQN
jgi:hypothetical protein